MDKTHPKPKMWVFKLGADDFQLGADVFKLGAGYFQLGAGVSQAIRCYFKVIYTKIRRHPDKVKAVSFLIQAIPYRTKRKCSKKEAQTEQIIIGIQI